MKEISRRKKRRRKLLEINLKEVGILMDLGLGSKDLWGKFIPILKIMERPKEKLINGIFESENVLIVSSNYEASLKSGFGRRSINVGINRPEKSRGELKGGLNKIHLKIYGTVIDLNVEEKTKAKMLYNLAAAWMGVDPNSISIEVCRIGKYIEGMGHILTNDEFYNFEWYKVRLTQKKMDIENYRLDPEENVDIMVDLMTIKFQARMNRFFRIATVERIIEIRFMKEYGMCPIFSNFSDTMYYRDMKLEMFEGEVLKGHVVERKFVIKKINYANESLGVSIEEENVQMLWTE
jgi:hypothetical protein